MTETKKLQHHDQVPCSSCHRYIPAFATQCSFCGAAQALGIQLKQASKSQFTKMADSKEALRNRAEATKLEALHIPHELRRRMKAAEWALSHPAVGVGLNILLALMAGLTTAQISRTLLPETLDLSRFRLDHPLPLRAIGFWAALLGVGLFSYGWAQRGVGWLREYLHTWLLETKAMLIDQSEKAKKLKEARESGRDIQAPKTKDHPPLPEFGKKH